ncbi:cobyrinate a,c-diamide synthase [Varunaivibrio sulfuroxidans]|uniref:Cobyrinate a,c-diamide synthase n=1 Tax=Varunaivibrio sulfuroxidans TaxID=1773489 RepID=A0A4R3J794_9PROT|nr:cobyrinate a,c-diamide synthase [Varunaivibrio sulfuroxidans]TCS60330.1 hydrogenobyrinic acid a,c-diamide synthase (glutamine-hydrolysing) /cobyrinate a,c-diamide synthase [Varunaivibrio sulfuroxidans]WES30983.1 cobyrinate a,c-diamide synthase [Varunaivibrio sulfuroxidans]
MAYVLISAAHKSSGKTTVTTGICAALANRGLDVRPFKKGPDYIDPMWLGSAAGKSCFNLDFNTQSESEIRTTFSVHGASGDISVIEGNKGLYDGMDIDGANANAALAKLLDAPVVLVINVSGMTRGIAPLLLGYQAFDPEVRIAGVILNMVGGPRHESKLRAVIAHYTDIPVIGAVHRNPAIALTERHLGLIPSVEIDTARSKISAMAKVIAEQVDLDALLTISKRAPETVAIAAEAAAPFSEVTVAVVRDSAFAFYYPDDLLALQRAGARLYFVDAMADRALPADIDALFIGGGFPETHIAALSDNRSLMRDIKQAIENGLPAYAECGGLMYMARTLSWRDEKADMVGVIPGDVVMHDRPQGRGYVRLRETTAMPWPASSDSAPTAPHQEIIAAHEFHYSSLENLPPGQKFAYDVLRGNGITTDKDGIVCYNLLANYAHLRDVQNHRWAARFVNFARRCAASTERRSARVTG